MFGFSLQKLLILALLIAGTWLLFRWIGRAQAQRKAEDKAARRVARRWRFGRATEPASEPPAEDMVACPVCGAYVSARAQTGCGRRDCPY